MGKEPGKPSGYDRAPAAIVGDKPTKPRRRTNHMFAGPDYSVIHPGIFPHNTDASEMATIREWLTYDYKAGWGTDDFEDTVLEDQEFPERWASIDDRYDAREIIEENLELFAWGQEQREAILRVGYVLGDVVTLKADKSGIKFKVQVRNGTDGHEVPTGFDAERVVFLQVTVTDSSGHVVMRSGDLDPNGDVRDLHSVYVHNGELPLDDQLFTLQSRFLTRNVRGGEREQVLPINYSLDPLPFLRPETRPTIIYGRPGAARKQRRTIPPLQERWPQYTVERTALTGNGPYTANVKFIAAMIPVNLLSEIILAGIDYGMTPRELAKGVQDGHILLWEKNLIFELD